MGLWTVGGAVAVFISQKLFMLAMASNMELNSSRSEFCYTSKKHRSSLLERKTTMGWQNARMT